MNKQCSVDESCRDKMLRHIRSGIPQIIGIILGGIGGYLYYSQVGCSSGSCAITSSPWMSILWGMMIGYLAGGIFNNKKNKTEEK
ncbi:MAG: hypothetical protein V2A54_05135 [Bacteroidota bacterium]